MEQVPSPVWACVRDARRIVVLSGAGMSAESGVPTFRDGSRGLWSRYDPATLATPEAFARDPALVFGWYAWRYTQLQQVEPNAGHRALARWADGAEVTIATQNVDDLHERAGSAVLAHLHGSLAEFRCFACERPYRGQIPVASERTGPIEPPRCGCGGMIRPGVVWFGEQLPAGALERAATACRNADVVLVVGTSGMVYPAAGLPAVARDAGVRVVEINPHPTPLSADATATWRATAATALPALVDAYLT